MSTQSFNEEKLFKADCNLPWISNKKRTGTSITVGQLGGNVELPLATLLHKLHGFCPPLKVQDKGQMR